MADLNPQPLPTPTTRTTFQQLRQSFQNLTVKITKEALNSSNYLPNTRGWKIDANGDVEFFNGVFRGALSAATIDIGGADTSSFHVDINGNLWAGAATFDINTNPFAVSNAGVLRAVSGSIGGWGISDTALSTGAFDTLNKMYFGTSGISLSNTFKVTSTGALTATSGQIGGFTLSSTSLYGGIIKTAQTVGVGNNGVIMDTAGLRGYDSVLGLVFNIPTDGSAPTFSSGIINSTIFEINTNAIMRTSATVGDGSADSAGILINNTGLYACEANQSLANANVRILTDGSAYFSGTFNIGGQIVTIGPTDNIQTTLDALNTAGGGTLYLTSGTWTLASNITLYSGISIIGVSPFSTFIDFNSTNKEIVIAGSGVYTTGTITSITSGTAVVGSGTSWLANVTPFVSHLFINGQWMLVAAVADNTHLTLAEGYDGPAIVAGASYRVATPIQNISLKGFTVKNSTNAGLNVDDCRYLNFENVFTQDNNIGLDVNYTTELFINNILPYSNTSHGITYTNGGRCNWNGVNSVSNGGGGVVLNGIRSLGLSTSALNANLLDGLNITSSSVITAYSSSFQANGENGMQFVSGNNDCQVTDINASNNILNGVKLTATTDRVSICQISCINNGAYGVNIAASTCDNNVINSPAFDSNTSGDINDDGTNTVVLPVAYPFYAEEDLTLGTFVGVSNDVSNKHVARALRLSDIQALGYTPDDNPRKGKECAIGGDKFAIISHQASDDSLYVTVGSLNRSSMAMTLGTGSAATADLNLYYEICKLDTDKFIVLYTEDASATIVKYRVGTVSGTTISWGSAATFFTGATNIANISLASLGTDKGIAIISCATGSDTKLVAFTVSTTTATMGIAASPDANIYASAATMISKVATDKFIVASTNKYAQVGTLSGTTITLGLAATFTATAMGGGTANENIIVSPATDVAVICFVDSGFNKENLVACTISGTTPTFGTEVAGSVNSYGLIAYNANTLYTVNHMNKSIKKWTLSTTTITYVGEVVRIIFPSATAIVMMDNGYYAVLGTSTSNLNCWIQGMSNQFLGVVNKTVSRGANVGVVTSGKIGGQTNLIPGAKYLFSASGFSFANSNASTSTLDQIYVQAISTTEVLL